MIETTAELVVVRNADGGAAAYSAPERSPQQAQRAGQYKLMHVPMCVRKYLSVGSKLQNLRPLATSEMVTTNAFFELKVAVKISRAWIISPMHKSRRRIAVFAATIVKRARAEFAFVNARSRVLRPMRQGSSIGSLRAGMISGGLLALVVYCSHL